MPTVIDMNANIAKPVFDIVETGNGEFTHQIPEAFHAEYIRGEGEAADKVKAGFKSIARELTNLNVGRVKLDPNHADQVNRGFRDIGNAITEMRTVLKADEKRLTDSLIEKSGFKADPGMTAIVVGTFQSMDPAKRASQIAKLIDENDGSTLAILDSVSSVYTGLADELKATIKNRLFAKVDPEAFAQLENIRFNLSRVEGASIASANACAKFSAPMHKAATAKPEVHKSVMG